MAEKIIENNHKEVNSNPVTETCEWGSAKPYNGKPGICVILNNMDFNELLPKLESGEEDEKCLIEAFENLGFDVKPHRNLNARQMRRKVEEYSQKDHEGVFILIILSHGKEGDIVYGTDEGEVKVHKLQEMFFTEKCNSLAGVPKVFLIDACRGDKDEKGYHPPEQKSETGKSKSGAMSITDSSDFLTVYASTRGNAAYTYTCEKSGMSGSYFTQTLAKVIKEAKENTEFTEIIREVRYRVQQEIIRQKESLHGQQAVQAQTVQAHSTLMNPYYIIRNKERKDPQLTLKNGLEEINLKMEKTKISTVVKK